MRQSKKNPCYIERGRAIGHTLEPKNTFVHFVMMHSIRKSQRKTFYVLHGAAEVVKHEVRFKSMQDFIEFILKLSQDKRTAGIYFVCPSAWRKHFIENYLEKINGTVFGWFVGFTNPDEFDMTPQKLVYRNKHHWFEFPVQLNFGRARYYAPKTEVEKEETYFNVNKLGSKNKN